MSSASPNYEQSLAALRMLRSAVFVELQLAVCDRNLAAFELAATRVAFEGTNISQGRLRRGVSQLVADPEYLPDPRAYIELPYDRGCCWQLVVDGKKAVISENAALVLAIRFGIPVPEKPLLVEVIGHADREIGDNWRLSKKARKLLDSAGVKVE